MTTRRGSGTARARGRRPLARLVALGLLLSSTLLSVPAAADGPDPDTESDRLFYEGNQLIAEGKTAEACERFERSLALRRRGGTLLNLALCREAEGALSRALPLFEEARSIAARDGRAAREETARQHIASLRPKLGWITLTVAASEGASATVTLDTRVDLDGEPIPREKWGADIPVMPGRHVVIARAPGKREVEVSVVVSRAGESHRVEIPPLVPEGGEPRPQRPPGSAAPTPASPDKPPPSEAVPPGDPSSRERDLSHAKQLGAIVRLDVDPLHAGVRVAVGGTVGVGDHCVMGASLLIGPVMGIEPQITLFLSGIGHWKPYVNAATPVFFASGDHAGVRLALGLQWDPNRHLGFFAQVGGAYFPGATEKIASEVLLPAAGVEGRF